MTSGVHRLLPPHVRRPLVNRFIAVCLTFGACCGALAAQEGSEPAAPASPPTSAAALRSELALRQLLGAGTPKPIPLWPGKPPKFMEDAPAETVDANARIRMVSLPTLSAYLPPYGKGTGMALIVCPGCGYGARDWKTHVVYAADYFVPKGVAVAGLKYRTRPPYRVDNAGIQEIALLDAKRAVRTVRDRAKGFPSHAIVRMQGSPRPPPVCWAGREYEFVPTAPNDGRRQLGHPRNRVAPSRPECRARSP